MPTKKKKQGGSIADVIKVTRKSVAAALKSEPIQRGIQQAVNKAISVVEGQGKNGGFAALSAGGKVRGPKTTTLTTRGGFAKIYKN